MPLEAEDVRAIWADVHAMIDALPPRPWVIRATHTVPYGRAFRQWDTHGRMIVWANRGEIMDMPRRPAKTSIPSHIINLDTAASIPVVFE